MKIEIIKHSADNWTALHDEKKTPAWLMCYLFVKYPAIQKLEMMSGYLTRDYVKTQIKDTARSLAATGETIEDIKKEPVKLIEMRY
jgi:hypothetical protein